MTIIEKPMPDRKPPPPSAPPAKPRAPTIGFLRPGHLERAFIVLLYIVLSMYELYNIYLIVSISTLSPFDDTPTAHNKAPPKRGDARGGRRRG